MGLFAKCNIYPGEVILSEKPLLLSVWPEWVQNTDGDDAANVPEGDAPSIVDPIRNMSDTQKMGLLRIVTCNECDVLTIHTVKKLDRDLRKAVTAYASNRSTLFQLLATFRRGIAFEGSVTLIDTAHLLNHSCVPNAEGTWNGDTQRYVVRAITGIDTSQEITIAYQSPF